MIEPWHILLVEDNRMDVELAFEAFRETCPGHSIHAVSSGKMALDYLFGRGKFADRNKYPVPNLVLLDLKLPGIDGIEVLCRIKETPGIKRLPVVVLTSSQHEVDRALAYDAGANGYLSKPACYKSFLTLAGRIKEYWMDLNLAPPAW